MMCQDMTAFDRSMIWCEAVAAGRHGYENRFDRR